MVSAHCTWQAASKCTASYATQDHVLVLRGSGDITLCGFMDSDWGTDIDHRQSISGYVFLLGCSTISGSLKKQETVATLSTEAEHMTSCHAMKEVMWLRSLLRLIGFEQQDSTIIFFVTTMAQTC